MHCAELIKTIRSVTTIISRAQDELWRSVNILPEVEMFGRIYLFPYCVLEIPITYFAVLITVKEDKELLKLLICKHHAPVLEVVF